MVAYDAEILLLDAATRVYDAVSAYEDDITFDAQLAVPNNDPVILPETFKEPVICRPAGNEILPEKYEAVNAVCT